MQKINTFLMYIVAGILSVLFCEQLVSLIFRKEDQIPIHCTSTVSHLHDSHKNKNNQQLKNKKISLKIKNNETKNAFTAVPVCSSTGDACHDQQCHDVLKPLEQVKFIEAVSCCEEEEPSTLSQPAKRHDHSKVRSLILILSISIHAIFEGIALTLQATSWNGANKLGSTLIPHKLAVGLTLGFQLKGSTLTKRHSMLALTFWAMVTPIGCLSGLFLCNELHGMLINNLNSFALGTFFYVLFFEIAPHEFMSHDQETDKLRGLKKAGLLLVGVAITYSISVAMPCTHSHGDEGHGHGHHGHAHADATNFNTGT